MSRSHHRARKAKSASPASLPTSAVSLGALAAGFGLSLAAPVLAQTATPVSADKADSALPEVSVNATVDRTPASKQDYKAETTSIAKGKQALRDIPQSVTVVTERLMDDRNLDDFKDVLRATSGITFLTGETGEEDIRLRGFSLMQAGDVYVDGIRDSALYERDTFNNDRIDVLKGSASMLFGRGSTGGVVNQVSKVPFLMTQSEVEASIGTGSNKRLTGDFNIQTGDDAALRINVMTQKAENWGATVDKKGIAPSYRWGIGTADEFLVSYYHLEYDNNPIYNHPWFLSNGNRGRIIPVLAANAFYGLDSDYNQGNVDYGTFSHTHRFDDGGELKSSLRYGRFKRDLMVSAISFASGTTIDNINDSTVISRRSKGRIGISNNTFIQSDYNNKFTWFGLKNNIITGVDLSEEHAERANNYANTGTQPTTTVGTPHDGDTVTDNRAAAAMNKFKARTLGLYAQNTLEITPTIKLIGGLRFDNFKADYDLTNGVDYSRTDNLWSPRAGALYQPNDWSSYYASYGTSYNTSGDTYQYAVGAASQRNVATPPESSRNIEVGAKFDLFEQRLSATIGLFHSEKYNERNTDPDTAAAQELLSGKRHANGMDVELAGRVTPAWEAFLSWTWIPDARIDKSNVVLASTGRGAQVEGDRPALTPKHSASLWSTYRVLPDLRLGAGLTHRSEQSPEGARQVIAPEFTTLDLMAEYTINKNFSAKVNVTNATNELYADGLYRGFYVPGAERTVTFSLKATF